MNEKEFRDHTPYTWPDFKRLFEGSHAWAQHDLELPVRVLELKHTANNREVHDQSGRLAGFVPTAPPTIELRAIDASGRAELIVSSYDEGHTWEVKNAQLHATPAYRDFVTQRERVEDKSPPIDLAIEAARAIAKAKKAFEE